MNSVKEVIFANQFLYKGLFLATIFNLVVRIKDMTEISHLKMGLAIAQGSIELISFGLFVAIMIIIFSKLSSLVQKA